MAGMNLQLRRLRQLSGMSQSEFAEALGEKPGTYGAWERGVSVPSLAQAFECARLLGCSIDALAGAGSGEGDPRSDALAGYFHAMNDEGRELLLRVAEHMSANPRLASQSAADPPRAGALREPDAVGRA